MRGKLGLVVGLAAGYVLGTRAGRERYEQIKDQALKVWELEPVQRQVQRVEDFGRSALLALPRAAWRGAVAVTNAVTSKGTPGERLDAAIDAGKDAAGDVADAAETSADAAEKAVKEAAAKTEKAAKKATSTRSGSSRSGASRSGASRASSSSRGTSASTRRTSTSRSTKKPSAGDTDGK